MHTPPGQSSPARSDRVGHRLGRDQWSVGSRDICRRSSVQRLCSTSWVCYAVEIVGMFPRREDSEWRKTMGIVAMQWRGSSLSLSLGSEMMTMRASPVVYIIDNEEKRKESKKE